MEGKYFAINKEREVSGHFNVHDSHRTMLSDAQKCEKFSGRST